MSAEYIALIILVVSIIALLTDKVPMSVVGIFIMAAFYLTGIMDFKEVTSVDTNSSTLLAAIMFLFSGAMFDVGIAQAIGKQTVRLVGQKKNGDIIVLGIIMLITILMCLFLPHFATAAVLMPVMISISSQTKISRSTTLMIMAMTTSFGGSITLIGTTTNILANGVLEDAGMKGFAFFDFAWIGLPCAVIGAIIMLLLYKKLIPSRYVEDGSESAKLEEIQDQENLKKRQIITGVTFGIFVLSIVFEKTTNISSSMVGMICVGILFVTKAFPEKKAFQSINWPTLIFICGILTLSNGLLSTGASDLIANSVFSLLGDTPSPYIIITVLFFISATLTQFISNTGAAGLLFPVGFALAAGLSADPRAITMAICIGCNSSFMTPIATPANTIITIPGHLKFSDWLKAGLPFLLMTYVLVVLIIPAVWPFYS
ncbi:MAG TPA: SLC13/DASS family transporter [Candidatus Pelethocola excrementipullorum]|nr:SLC13/DASS family transporter [Candidatus Pelethocola excrementipullorum]